MLYGDEELLNLENLAVKLDVIKSSILEIVPARQIYLFGSQAYGKPTEKSDIDIMVVVDDKYKNVTRTELYPKIIKKIANKNIFFVDLVFSWESKFNGERKNCRFETTIREQGQLLYGNK